MKKNVELDFSPDRLFRTAEKLIDARDYIGALKILNKNCDMNGEDGYAHLLYAQIFDDMGIYERCINEWFKFLAGQCYVDDEDINDAYEGLAVAYMNIGNEQFSAYYYNCLLKNSDDIGEEARSEIMQSFLSREPNPLKFVYPPEIADCSDVISDGVDYMKSGEYDKAVEQFKKVDKKNKSYVTARNYMAMSYIISDRADKAEKVCRDVLAVKPDDVHALTTLVAVKTEQKDFEASKQLAKQLLTLDVEAPDDLFKIATVCCENGLHAEAYERLCKLEEKIPYDTSVEYFKAISAFNSGNYDACFASFDRLLTINPRAITAKYFYAKAREAVKKGDKTPLSYFYRLPQSERESSLKLLVAIGSLSAANTRKAFEAVDVSDYIYWCFDESEGNGNTELQYLSALCAVKGRLDGVVSDILLNAFVDDELKLKVLQELGLRNEDASFNAVICNVLKTVPFRKLNLGRLKKKAFVEAYSYLTAHFSLISPNFSQKFARAAEDVYTKLENENRLGEVDAKELAPVILLCSKVKVPRLTKRSDVCRYFEVDGNKLSEKYGV